LEDIFVVGGRFEVNKKHWETVLDVKDVCNGVSFAISDCISEGFIEKCICLRTTL
jgi:hypothetical protein